MASLRPKQSNAAPSRGSRPRSGAWRGASRGRRGSPGAWRGWSGGQRRFSSPPGCACGVSSGARRNTRRARPAACRSGTPLRPEDVVLPDPAQPAVSVIIPTFGKVDYTLRCLASIAAAPPAASAEVIVIDDASGDRAVASLEGVRNLRLIASDVNRGFLRTCNEAARRARGEYLLLLNNDTEVLPGWLEFPARHVPRLSGHGRGRLQADVPGRALAGSGRYHLERCVRDELRPARRSGQAAVQLRAGGGLLLGLLALDPPRRVRRTGRFRRAVRAGLLRGQRSRLPPARTRPQDDCTNPGPASSISRVSRTAPIRRAASRRTKSAIRRGSANAGRRRSTPDTPRPAGTSPAPATARSAARWC